MLLRLCTAAVALAFTFQPAISRPNPERGPYVERCFAKFSSINERKKEQGKPAYTSAAWRALCENDYEAMVSRNESFARQRTY